MFGKLKNRLGMIPDRDSGTQRWVSDTETIIIPGKISIVSAQVPSNWKRQNGRGTSTLNKRKEGSCKRPLGLHMAVPGREGEGLQVAEGWMPEATRRVGRSNVVTPRADSWERSAVWWE
ncbi:hypothetical protein E2C01_052627 [Portunus trituberculatus]|uniref:Uncharacterized protein n=1 Tax=Portunus trituberculatus TaxID=210409 RepID=A0A5B7GE80_PORTR|nr:hypothetical protein [Portunus trituberculatus]